MYISSSVRMPEKILICSFKCLIRIKSQIQKTNVANIVCSNKKEYTCLHTQKLLLTYTKTVDFKSLLFLFMNTICMEYNLYVQFYEPHIPKGCIIYIRFVYQNINYE